MREHLGNAERAEVRGVIVLADADERPAEFAAGADIPRGVADVGDAVEIFAAVVDGGAGPRGLHDLRARVRGFTEGEGQSVERDFRRGELVACGTPAEIRANPESLTGRYMAGTLQIPVPKKRRADFERCPPPLARSLSIG